MLTNYRAVHAVATSVWQGDALFVKADYIISLAKNGGRIPRRQELPEDACVQSSTLRFWKYQKLMPHLYDWMMDGDDGCATGVLLWIVARIMIILQVIWYLCFISTLIKTALSTYRCASNESMMLWVRLPLLV